MARKTAGFPLILVQSAGWALPTGFPCSECGVTMIPKRIWDKLSGGQKSIPTIRQEYGDLCSQCHFRKYRQRKTWRLADLVDEVESLLDMGVTTDEAARIVGLKYNSLARSFDRARAKGLTTRKIWYRHERKTA
jgi:hypothetical protein